MLGKRSRQRGLFEADPPYLEFVGRDSFYGFLASQRDQLFRDEDFAEFYSSNNGRPSVPPSLLANALLLQTHDQVSDEEAKARADYDLRWKVALGIEIDARPFAKSTLQLFRAQLILKEKMRAVFTRSLEYAKQAGYLKERRLRVLLDTTYILGRGAVKDTYNLLGDGIQQLCRALAQAQQQELKDWVAANTFEDYFGTSLKGQATVDWTDEQSQRAFLQRIVNDAQRLQRLAQETCAALAKDHPQQERIAQAGQLLDQLITQDVEFPEGQAKLKEGVSQDGSFRCMTARCATDGKAAPSDLMVIKRRLQSMPRANSFSRWKYWQAMPGPLAMPCPWWKTARPIPACQSRKRSATVRMGKARPARRLPMPSGNWWRKYPMWGAKIRSTKPSSRSIWQP